MLTEQALKEIRERADKATSGPWYSTLYEPHEDGEETRKTWTVGPEKDETNWKNDCNYYDYGMHKRDAVFAAHARTDIPALLDMVEKLKKEIKYLAGSIQRYIDDLSTLTSIAEGMAEALRTSISVLGSEHQSEDVASQDRHNAEVKANDALSAWQEWKKK